MKLGYALGGGGARGAAHIGVLMELEQLGLKPDIVVGTSMGGLLGALVAAGQSAEAILDFFKHLHLDEIYRPAPLTAPALGSNKPIEALLESRLGRPSFADLEIPFAVVATDLASRAEVILAEGDVVRAVLATIAIPLALPPIKIEGMTLVDGGIKNNLPFNIARQMGADFVVAVELTNTTPYLPEAERTEKKGPVTKTFDFVQRQAFWEILSATIDVVTNDNTNHHIAENPPDLLLRPKIGTIGLFDFHRWQDGVSAGRTAVWEVEDVLEKVSTAF